ncbi:ataxin-2-like protein isoform X2 [Gigantopelta aegis]|uniref:ataxin-2-like protein isoform X2 n=1 Tax=Gigantopelta aegis TaxID=1735272 RepID=UPI001B88BD7C|nr:ataxin-2-like protein isoform X2 [Gigantopelta aegis]
MSVNYNRRLPRRNNIGNASHQPRNVVKRSTNTQEKLQTGVYSNSRFTHVIFSLVGCVVHVQVKNGSVYEGIFKTISPDMDVVLEMAHKLDSVSSGGRKSMNNIPSKDRIIDKIVFDRNDVVTVTAVNVDLEYAVRDSFTDTAISRHNGQGYDSEVRELQPWESEGGTELALDHDSNGWDVQDMFKTNAEQFRVKSTYDESLQQYTTPLKKSDTKEYKQREQEAERLCKEIEKTDDHRTRKDLENGDGDEESKFSAVQRVPDRATGNGPTDRYVPPHGRSGGSNILPRRETGPRHMRSNVPNNKPRVTSPPVLQSVSNLNPNSCQVSKDGSAPSVSINGEKEMKPNDPVVVKTSPELTSVHAVPLSSPTSSSSSETKQDSTVQSPNSTPHWKGPDRRNSNFKGKEAISSGLREFKENFKIVNQRDKESKMVSEAPEEPQPEERVPSNESPKTKLTVKSTLNPMAREFVPVVKQTTKQPVPQTPTPPRPQTQSPVIQPAVPVPMPQSIMFPNNFMPVGPPQPIPTQPSRYAKRVPLSMQPRPDYSAAVQHATGQPLLAQASVPTQQLMYHVIPQGAPTSYQVMSVPTNPSRMVAPTSMQINAGGMDPSQAAGQLAHSPQIYMAPPGPVPAHVNPHVPGQPMSHPQPAHIGPVPAGNPQNQTGQMTPVSGPHPAPSPVQHNVGPGGQQQHQGPPQSGTPQPPVNYQQISLQGHPQLHSGSQNPASPQGMHPASMPYATHAQQFTFTQAQQPTSVSHTMHSHTHSPHIHPQQYVMMPHPPSHNQVQHPHVQPQFQPSGQHPIPGGGPTPVHGQSHLIQHPGMPTSIPVSAASGMHPSQLHYLPQVPSQAAPVPSYQQGQ